MSWDGIDRRGENRPSDIVYTLAKVEEKFATLESKIDSKLDHACEDISSLREEKDKLIAKYEAEAEKKHIELERKIYQNFKIELTKILNKLEILVGGNESTQITLNRFESRVERIEGQVKLLQDGPKQRVYETVLAIGKKVGWAILLALGAMLMYAIQNGFINTIGK